MLLEDDDDRSISIREEILDLLEDIPDMMDEIERRLSKGEYSTSSAAPGGLGCGKNGRGPNPSCCNPFEPFYNNNNNKDRRRSLSSSNNKNRNNLYWHPGIGVSRYTSNPPHPDAYLAYIRQYASNTSWLLSSSSSASAPSAAVQVVSRLCHIRFLYQKALHSVGSHYPSTTSTAAARNTPTASSSIVYGGSSNSISRF